VANGISPAPHTRPRESLRRELGIPLDVPLVLNVGSLTWQKAQAGLLEAMASKRTEEAALHLVIAGDGPLGAELAARRTALGLGLASICWRALGCRGPDGGGGPVRAVVRARGLVGDAARSDASWRLAVVTDVGGNAEAVASGVTGIVVKDDLEALAWVRSRRSRAIQRFVSDGRRGRRPAGARDSPRSDGADGSLSIARRSDATRPRGVESSTEERHAAS
jgi:glycosyltransferase involved in cell wall biosynthesis